MGARISTLGIFSPNSRTKLLCFSRDAARSDRRTRDLKEAVKFPGTEGMKRKKWMMKKKNSDLCNKWAKGGDLCELWAETSETKVAAPEGRVARGGICLAADEEGAIRSEMAMGKWGAKTLEMWGRGGRDQRGRTQEEEERACIMYGVCVRGEGEGRREKDFL